MYMIYKKTTSYCIMFLEQCPFRSSTLSCPHVLSSSLSFFSIYKRCLFVIFLTSHDPHRHSSARIPLIFRLSTNVVDCPLHIVTHLMAKSIKTNFFPIMIHASKSKSSCMDEYWISMQCNVRESMLKSPH